MEGEFGLVGRAGTPQPIIQKISAAFNKTLAHPEVINTAKRLDYILVTMSPERFDELIKDGVKKYAQIIKAANIKVE